MVDCGHPHRSPSRERWAVLQTPPPPSLSRDGGLWPPPPLSFARVVGCVVSGLKLQSSRSLVESSFENFRGSTSTRPTSSTQSVTDVGVLVTPPPAPFLLLRGSSAAGVGERSPRESVVRGLPLSERRRRRRRARRRRWVDPFNGPEPVTVEDTLWNRWGVAGARVRLPKTLSP